MVKVISICSSISIMNWLFISINLFLDNVSGFTNTPGAMLLVIRLYLEGLFTNDHSFSKGIGKIKDLKNG